MNPSNPDPDRQSAVNMPNAGQIPLNQKIEEDVRHAKHELGSQARQTAGAGKHRLANEADALSEAIDAAASKLDDHDREGLARYARDLSSKLAHAAGQLEGRSVDELANDAKDLARNNPALFMLGSMAVGFGLSRFFKATSDRDHQDYDSASGRDRSPTRHLAESPSSQTQPDMAETSPTLSAAGSHQGRELP